MNNKHMLLFPVEKSFVSYGKRALCFKLVNLHSSVVC